MSKHKFHPNKFTGGVSNEMRADRGEDALHVTQWGLLL